jgi:xylose isomerase
MALAKLKADVAFEMFDILGVPFYCFHDADAPRRRDLCRKPAQP